MIETLHHIQLAMPPNKEDQARDFYIEVLGFEETDKPATLQDRGGVWFKCSGIEVHLGIEDPFVPARKAHPAFRVASLDQTVRHLQLRNIRFRRDVDLPAFRRVFINDPFGNRIELLEVTQ